MSGQHCADADKCGRPQDGPGHPKKGWIRTHVAGAANSTRWWCSLRCLIAGFTQTEVTSRDDVALCVTCINRHDRDHRCPLCGNAPQITRAVPTPARRLFTNLGAHTPDPAA